MGVATPAPPKDTGAAGSGLGSTGSNGGGDAESRKAAEESLADKTVEITGTGQLGFDVGGKEPTGATLTLTGGKFQLAQRTAFAKGERLTVEVKDADGTVLAAHAALVDEIAFKDERDSKTGQVIACKRNHKARITAG